MEAPALTEPTIPGLDAYLEPGERVLWTGAPDSEALGKWPTSLKVGVAVVLATIPVGYGLGVLADAHAPYVISMFMLVPALIIFLPGWAEETARRSHVYAITDRRAICWPRNGQGRRMGYAPLPCDVGESGSGPGLLDLLILGPASPQQRRDGVSPVLFTFYLIRDHDTAMRLLLPPGEHDRRKAEWDAYLHGETDPEDEDDDDRPRVRRGRGTHPPERNGTFTQPTAKLATPRMDIGTPNPGER